MRSRGALRRRAGFSLLEVRQCAGFSLLEVLAAVAVLGVLYAVLATAAADAMRMEGDASRRIGASLLADRALAEIEEQVALGQTPRLGFDDREEEIYAIETEVRAIDLAGPLRALLGEQADGRRLELLAPAANGRGAPLLEIVVAVRWIEGAYERQLRRTGYVFASAAVEAQLEEIASARGADARADEELEEDEAGEVTGRTFGGQGRNLRNPRSSSRGDGS